MEKAQVAESNNNNDTKLPWHSRLTKETRLPAHCRWLLHICIKHFVGLGKAILACHYRCLHGQCKAKMFARRCAQVANPGLAL